MAYNKVVVDVEARFVDNVTGQAKKVNKIIDDLDKKDPEVEIGVEDNASKTLNKLDEQTKKLANKITDINVKLKDNDALTKLNKIGDKAASLAKGAWTATVKIKDMATAPIRAITRRLFSLKTLAAGIIMGAAANKYVKQPVQMYANYEDLVTQFAVLLKGNSDSPNYDAAKARIDELTAFAGQTPFTRDEIYQASRVLQTYTQGALATPDSTGGLRMIGDIAAATGAEYTQVATYMGRLYNEVKRGGESMGEPLAFLREMGALSAEQEEKIKEIAQGSGTIEERWEKIADQFKNTDGMMLEMSNQMNNLMLGVKSFFKNNLFMKLGEGISESLKPFLIDFRAWRNANGDIIAGWAADIKQFAADASGKVLGVIQRTASRAAKIMQSSEFQNSDLFGKISMLWKGAISNPFADWWNRTVVPWWDRTAMPWITEKANNIGKIIGTGLTNGLLALLGLDVMSAADDGVSIAGSFVQGFLDGFDGSAITQAFLDAIGNIWSGLPFWAQALLGTIGVGKAAGGIQSLAGKASELFGNIRGGIGSAGNAMVGGSGALGTLADIGYAATGGAAGSTMGGGMAALAGGVTVAGGIAGIASLISGINDIRKFRNVDYAGGISDAHAASGTLKTSGALMGAAIGTAIAPGIGTAIGAALGGIAGWAGGSLVKKDSVKGARTSELEAWAQSSKEAAAELERRQKLIQESFASTFGEISLSYNEIQDLAQKIVPDKLTTSMKEYSSATVSANKAMQNLESTTSDINKWTWKANLGFEFTDSDKESYKKAIENYISQGEAAVESEHYQFTAAVSVLLDPEKGTGKSLIETGNEFYASIQKKLSENSEKLQVILDGAEFTGKEEAIQDLLKERAEILEQVTKAEQEAELETLKIKYSAGELSLESFQQLQSEISETIASQKVDVDEALQLSISRLKLMGLGEEEYKTAIEELTESYKANIGEIEANAESLQIEILGDAYENILGEDSVEKINKAIDTALEEGLLPKEWTLEEAQRILGVEGLEEDSALALGNMITSIMETTMPQEVARLAEATSTKVRENVSSSLSAQTITASPKLELNFKTSYSGLPDGLSLGNSSAHARGGLVGMSIPGYSGGGMVRGGAQLAMLAEEGTPEMVIPLGLQRRMRGMKLWEKAGQMLGVPGFAEGGLVGGSGDEGLRFQQYGGGNAAGSGDQSVQVNVGGVTVEVNVNGNEDGGIVEAIKAQGNEIAETVAGILADAFNSQFQNTPVRGGA